MARILYAIETEADYEAALARIDMLSEVARDPEQQAEFWRLIELVTASAKKAIAAADRELEIRNRIFEMHFKVPNVPPHCLHCSAFGEAVLGRDLFEGQRELAWRVFWRCNQCDAHVAAHADGRPLGYPANLETRRARNHVHHTLDPMWKHHPHPEIKRERLYKNLSVKMGLPIEKTHIGMFDLAQCEQALRHLEQWRGWR